MPRKKLPPRKPSPTQPADPAWSSPTALPPAPRSVAARPGRGWFRRCLPVLLIPHAWAGVAIAVFVAVDLASAVRFRLLGKVVPGQVTGLLTYKRSKGGHSFSVRYTYRWGSVERSAESSIDEAGFGLLAEGDAVEVRVLDGSRRSPRLLAPGAPTDWPSMAGIVCFVLVWNGALLLGTSSVAVWPLIQRALVRRGVAVAGEITAKEAQVHKGTTTYKVRYRYRTLPPPGGDAGGEGGAMREGAMAVEEDDYVALAVGERVTVLCSGRWPRWSVVYRCAPYRALGAGSAAPAS
jgi:hypothetical protein